MIDAPGALIDVSGGAGASNNGGFPGRILLGDNVVGPAIIGTLSGAAPEAFAGPREDNPFVDGSPSTPFIAGLVGGAEIHGLAPVLPAEVPSVIENAPNGAIAALARLASGPATLPDSYDGFHMLLVVNLSPGALGSPAVGAGAPGFATPLLTRGIAGNPAFGGAGPTTLTQLALDGVWITLVPAAAQNFTLGAAGETVSTTDLVEGEPLYLLAGVLPCPWDCGGTPNGVVDTVDFLALLQHWGPAGGGGPCDFDNNGIVDTVDFLALLQHWGPCP